MVELTRILLGEPQTYFTKMPRSFRTTLTENGGSSSERVLCMNQYSDPAPEGNGLVTGSCVLPRVSHQCSPRAGRWGGRGGHCRGWCGGEHSPAGSANFLSLALLQLQGEQGSPAAAAATFWLAVCLLAAWLGKWPRSLCRLPTTCSLSSCSSTSEGHPPSRARQGSIAPTADLCCKRKLLSLT